MIITISFLLAILLLSFGVIIYSAENTNGDVINNGIDPVQMALIRNQLRQDEYPEIKEDPWLKMSYTERIKEMAKMKRIIKGQNREIRRRMMANVIKEIK